MWNAYLARARDDASFRAGPFRDDLSLRFGTEGNTRRVTALFWGNGARDLRLDVRAGVGATVAMVRQREEHFLIYAPMEGRAFFHEGAASPLLKMGVPLPLDLPRLEALVHNRFADVFGTVRDGTARAVRTGDGVAFVLAKGNGAEGDAGGRSEAADSGEATGAGRGMGGTLVLDGAGVPRSWSDAHWTMVLGYDDAGLVDRVDLTRRDAAVGDADMAVLLVKKRADNVARFDDAAMELEIPASATLDPLDRMTRRGR